MNMEFFRKLPTPKEIKQMYPLNEKLALQKEQNDQQIKAIFENKSNKLLLIIGPCSADNEDAAMKYLHLLKEVQEEVKDKIVIIPRLYTNKPRTTTLGYKGMLHQPNPLSDPDMLNGLISIRKLHMRALEETGFSCADEMLYPENHRYLSDLLSYTAVGARSVENQNHRLTASGLTIPVGMKNPTNGDLSLMLNAINAAQHSHTFIYRGWEVKSKGNSLAHAVLRGYTDINGQVFSNYQKDSILKLYKLYNNANYINPSLIIDTNHCNSNKNYLKQVDIVNEVLSFMKDDANLQKFIKGFMIESYLEDGNQNIDGGIFGKSITDPCLGWNKTKNLILNIYTTLKTF